MKAIARSLIPFLTVLLIVLACGNTKQKDSSINKKEETVNTQKEKGNTKSDSYSDSTSKDSNLKKKKKKDSYNNFKDNSTSQVETYKPRYRIGAICCDGTRSSATGKGACSHHGGVCQWLYSN
jgi:hypothetical protein